MDEFNLSEKRKNTDDDRFNVFYFEKDVKEFIKRLKELAMKSANTDGEGYFHCDEIDKLAGDKLI